MYFGDRWYLKPGSIFLLQLFWTSKITYFSRIICFLLYKFPFLPFILSIVQIYSANVKPKSWKVSVCYVFPAKSLIILQIIKRRGLKKTRLFCNLLAEFKNSKYQNSRLCLMVLSCGIAFPWQIFNLRLAAEIGF